MVTYLDLARGITLVSLCLLWSAASGQEAGSALGGQGVAGPALRMIVSLAAVLALLGGCAWLAKRLRAGGAFQNSAIEIVSGISLGGRERVVLLRVGGEEILVGISAAGIRPLHVLREKAEPREFDEYFEATQTLEVSR